LVKLVLPEGDALDDVLDMLQELSQLLPRFHSYEQTLPMTEGLESALMEVYTEMICFCARTINFFHSYPHRQLPSTTTNRVNEITVVRSYVSVALAQIQR